MARWNNFSRYNNPPSYVRNKNALVFPLPQEGEHPIVPVMLGDARLAADFADDMLARGIYVIGFSYPVVPKGSDKAGSGLLRLGGLLYHICLLILSMTVSFQA